MKPKVGIAYFGFVFIFPFPFVFMFIFVFALNWGFKAKIFVSIIFTGETDAD